jgi:hypothetical protein
VTLPAGFAVLPRGTEKRVTSLVRMTKPQPSSLRDTRIDVLRAIALITIFVNHVPNNPFEQFTSKNFGFSDAAEAFVLIAGVSAALAYGLKFQPGQMLATTLKAWRRSGVLYISQLCTTMITLGIFAWFALRYGSQELLEMINIAPVITDTPKALIGLVTFGHQLGYNNILSMYAIVLLIVPALLLIGRASLPLMVAASGTLWLAAGLLRIGPANFPNEGVWFLNPLSWQFLFIIGTAAMMHVRRGGELPVNRWLVSAAAGYLVLSLAWVKLPLWGIDTSMGLPTVLTGFDKTYLSAPRLLHVLAAGYLVAVTPRLSNLARLSESNPLTIMGRHSLPVFVAGTILSMVAQALRVTHDVGVMGDAGIIVVGLSAQLALAYYIEWYRGVVRASKPAPSHTAGATARKLSTPSLTPSKAKLADA